MENVTIIRGESGRTLRPKLTSGTVLYGVNLRRAFEARYGFLESPSKAEDYDLRDGRIITFKHGYFDGRVIDQFEILAAGIRASGQNDTSVSDAFLDDVVQWAESEAGLEFDDTQATIRVYTSIIEARMNGGIATLADAISSVGGIMAQYFHSYGAPRDDFELAGLTIHGDPAVPGPGPFRFERRAGEPRASNTYFSGAPLRTEDHIRVLQLIEEMMI